MNLLIFEECVRSLIPQPKQAYNLQDKAPQPTTENKTKETKEYCSIGIMCSKESWYIKKEQQNVFNSSFSIFYKN